MDRVITELGEDAWTAMSCGDGAHGPRIYDWAITDIRPLRLVDRGHWLPARRSRTDPTDIAYYVCFETPRKKGGTQSGHDHTLIPLSSNEIRRLWNRITTPITHTIRHILHWSDWRRTSQTRARISHYTRRGHHNLSLQY